MDTKCNIYFEAYHKYYPAALSNIMDVTATTYISNAVSVNNVSSLSIVVSASAIEVIVCKVFASACIGGITACLLLV